MTGDPEHRTSDASGPALVLAGAVSLQGGSTVARQLIPIAGVPGTVALRVTLGAAMLSVRKRPSLPAGRKQLGLLAVVGLVLAVQHLAFYASIDRLPLGVAVTLEFFSGPLALAFASSRRPRQLLWVLVAAAGVVLASDVGTGGHWQALGIVLALIAGITWALYIVLFPRTGAPDDRGGALAGVTIVAAVIALPYGIVIDHAVMFSLEAIGLGALVALLADVTAYTLQAHALSRVSVRTFSVLVSTQPAVAALFGLAALGQEIHLVQWIGIAAVVTASAATADRRGRSRAHAAS